MSGQSERAREQAWVEADRAEKLRLADRGVPQGQLITNAEIEHFARYSAGLFDFDPIQRSRDNLILGLVLAGCAVAAAAVLAVKVLLYG